MNHNYEKELYEAFAKKVLELAFPDVYINLTPSEKPDILMGEKHGIEVTRAFYDNTAEIEHLYNKIKNQVYDKDNKLQHKVIDRLRSC